MKESTKSPGKAYDEGVSLFLIVEGSLSLELRQTRREEGLYEEDQSLVRSWEKSVVNTVRRSRGCKPKEAGSC